MRSLEDQRLPALMRVRDFLARRPASLTAILTEISTHRAASYEIDAAAETLDGAVAELAAHRPGELGRAAVFMPSNVLLYSYVLYLLVPALFVERLAFRPSRQVSEQMMAVHELLRDLHGLPIDAEPVSQRAFVEGPVRDADLAVFTGTYQNAEQIRSQLSEEQLFLYLGGGVNPFVVTESADVTRAVRAAIEIRMLNSGQDCLAPDLFLVDARRLDEFLARLVDGLERLRFGCNEDPDADYGPICYQGALEEAALFLFRHQRAIVHGGAVDFRTRMVQPSVVVRELAPKPSVPELFAPIFNVSPFEDVEDVARLLTSGIFSERAMGATVFGHAPELVEALARRHVVTTDATLLSVDDGNAPFGGRGPMANYVAHRGKVRAEPILISKAVASHVARRDAGAGS